MTPVVGMIIAKWAKLKRLNHARQDETKKLNRNENTSWNVEFKICDGMKILFFLVPSCPIFRLTAKEAKSVIRCSLIFLRFLHFAYLTYFVYCLCYSIEGEVNDEAGCQSIGCSQHHATWVYSLRFWKRLSWIMWTRSIRNYSN